MFIKQQLFQSVFQSDFPLRKIFGKGWQAGERGKKVRLLGLAFKYVVSLAVVLRRVLLGLNWNKYILRRKQRNKQTCCGFCPCESKAPYENKAPHFVD